MQIRWLFQAVSPAPPAGYFSSVALTWVRILLSSSYKIAAWSGSQFRLLAHSLPMVVSSVLPHSDKCPVFVSASGTGMWCPNIQHRTECENLESLLLFRIVRSLHRTGSPTGLFQRLAICMDGEHFRNLLRVVDPDRGSFAI